MASEPAAHNTALKKYRKREGQYVTAVQLLLDTDGIRYRKWGAAQHCRSGDWLVNNNGDCYTIGQASFEKTYQRIAPGQYVKRTPVWASRAEESGSVKTLEGSTAYAAGDYIVSNNPDGTDAYAVAQDKFESMYELLSDQS